MGCKRFWSFYNLEFYRILTDKTSAGGSHSSSASVKYSIFSQYDVCHINTCSTSGFSHGMTLPFPTCSFCHVISSFFCFVQGFLNQHCGELVSVCEAYLASIILSEKGTQNLNEKLMVRTKPCCLFLLTPTLAGYTVQVNSQLLVHTSFCSWINIILKHVCFF